jgi:hypothetical protein
MKLQYVDGRGCGGGPCPGLYVTDRGTLVVVGDLVDHAPLPDLAGRVAEREGAVEMPMELIDWIAKVRRSAG